MIDEKATFYLDYIDNEGNIKCDLKPIQKLDNEEDGFKIFLYYEALNQAIQHTLTKNNYVQIKEILTLLPHCSLKTFVSALKDLGNFEGSSRKYIDAFKTLEKYEKYPLDVFMIVNYIKERK